MWCILKPSTRLISTPFKVAGTLLLYCLGANSRVLYMQRLAATRTIYHIIRITGIMIERWI